MKKIFTQFGFILSLFLITSQSLNAQTVYFREGFDDGTTDLPSSSTDPQNLAGYYPSLPSGVWYIFGAYRTTGTNCVGYGTGHLRTLSTSQGLVGDSAKVVTPILSNGVSEIHFSRCRAQRAYGIYYRNDTTGAATTGWTLIQNVERSPIVNADTAILASLPNARRIMITGDIDAAGNNSNQDFDSIWIVSATPVIPVKFNGISANYSNGMVKVIWNNETEVNASVYQIERSTDGNKFVTVGTVNAVNSRQYSWFDYSPLSGNNFYRIKAVDIDGKLTYSSIVKLSLTSKLQEMAINPNPVKNGQLNLQLANIEKGNYTFNVFNRTGQVVFSKNIGHTGGSSSELIQLPASIGKGLYDVQLKGALKTLTKTIILQ